MLSTPFLILLFSFGTSMKFGDITLNYNYPLNENSFYVTYDQEIIIRGSNISRNEREAYKFDIFRSDYTHKASINLKDYSIPSNIDIISAQAIVKHEDHYIVLMFGRDKEAKKFDYRLAIFKDGLDYVEFIGFGVWDDTEEAPKLRNLSVTQEGLFGFAHVLENDNLIGSYWLELGITFTKDGAVFYNLENDFFKFDYTGKGIRSSYTNSWLTAFNDTVFMLNQPETLINVATKKETYKYKSTKSIPLKLENFRSYSLLAPAFKGHSIRYDATVVNKDLLLDSVAINAGLFQIDHQLMVAYLIPSGQKDNRFDLFLQSLSLEGEIIGKPFVFESAWLAGVVNGKIIIIDQIEHEADQSNQYNYYPFEFTVDSFTSTE